MRPALLACALCLAAGFGPGAAVALAGSGVTVSSSENSETVTLTSAQIRGAADTGPTTYTVRSSPNSSGTKLRLRGLSIRGLLTLAGYQPDSIDFISIPRPSGDVLTLRRADFANPSPFAEGPALVVDEPGGTRFLRPVRGPTSTNARDSFVSSAPLDVTVGGGVLLAVRASATPRRASTGRTVSFSARVRFPPPGATLTYEWDFGDGTKGFGAQATHQYSEEGEFQAQVTARGTGGSTAACPETCGGAASISVRVGKPRTSPRPDRTQGSTGANPDASGTGGSGSGSGGSGSGDGDEPAAGDDAPAANERPRGERAPRAAAGETVTGILLADSGTAQSSSLPSLRSAGATPAREGSEGSQGGGRLGGSIALTLALIALGALYERRDGRLRVA